MNSIAFKQHGSNQAKILKMHDIHEKTTNYKSKGKTYFSN